MGIIRKIETFFDDWGLLVAAYVVIGAIVVGSFAAMYHIGSALPANITYHEQEHAHCYTAGKMFFVSIACVPKSEYENND